MRGRMVTWMVAVMVAALAGMAGAAHEGQLDRAQLAQEAKLNKALARYLKQNGYPDMAEVKPILDQPPWDDHEVVLYYLKNRKEIAFARASVLGRPNVHTTRYERVMTDADIRALKAHGARIGDTPAPSGDTAAKAADPSPCTGSAAKRAECAAGRAENAAERVDLAAVRAENAATRTEAIVEKMVAYKSKHRH